MNILAPDFWENRARYLMALNLLFVIHQPPDLYEALLRLGEQMVQIVTVPLPPSGNGSKHSIEEM